MATRFRGTGLLLFVSLMVAGPAAATGQALTNQEKRIVDYANTHNEDVVAFLAKVVNIRSATLNFAGVRQVGEVFLNELESMGFDTTWIGLPDSLHRAGHLMARRGGKGGKKILLLGHLDTVLEDKPFSQADGVGHGPGVYDMKGGDVVLLYALKAMHAAGVLDRGSITVVLTGDEENPGMPTTISRQHMIDAAGASDFVLSFEGLRDGTVVTSRRGSSWWRLDVGGHTGHSSRIFSDSIGNGAIYETARILNAFHEGLRFDPMVTVSPSVVVGGTKVTFNATEEAGTASGKHNVVSQIASVEGDLRFLRNAQKEQARDTMRTIVERHLPGTRAAIAFWDGYPAMASTRGSEALAEQYQRLSMTLGYGKVVPGSPDLRGAGDIAFVSTIIPGLDGLGPEGGGGHTSEEYVALDTLPMQISRAALLIHRLTR